MDLKKINVNVRFLIRVSYENTCKCSTEPSSENSEYIKLCGKGKYRSMDITKIVTKKKIIAFTNETVKRAILFFFLF